MNPLNSIRRGASAVNKAQSGEPQKKSTANNIPLRTLSPTGTRPAPPRLHQGRSATNSNWLVFSDNSQR